MDMPAAIVEYFPGVSVEAVSAVVEDYQPIIKILQETWSQETFMEIMQGKVSVPDSVINEAIAERLDETQPVTQMTLTSKENGRLEIRATSKKLGRLEFSGLIEEFKHNTEESLVTYRVKERALKDHGLASWFFSRMSLSMAQSIFGKIDLGEALPTTIKGNRITIDCRSVLEQSQLARAELQGYRVLDMVEIKNAVPHDGYIQFETELHVPSEVRTMILNVLLTKGSTWFKHTAQPTEPEEAAASS